MARRILGAHQRLRPLICLGLEMTRLRGAVVATAAMSILLGASASQDKPPAPPVIEAGVKLAEPVHASPQAKPIPAIEDESRELERSCPTGVDNRSSDLCAQWTSADAAREAAIWTRRSALIAVVAALLTLGTLLAAVAAAWYARAAAGHAKSAVGVADRAAEDSKSATAELLAENGRQRRLATLPILTVQTDYFGLNLSYPWPEAHNPGTMVTAIDEGGGEKSPAITVKNHGQGAALDVRVSFVLDERGADLSLAPWAADLGFSIVERTVPEQGRVFSLQIGESGWALYRTAVVDLPVCAAGSTTEIDIPYSLLLRLFTLGLRPLAGHGGHSMHLALTVEYTSVEGEDLRYEAAFDVTPFSHGPTSKHPIEMHTHVHWRQLPGTVRPVFHPES